MAKQLGHYDIPDSFEYDLEIQERYQSFSSEILRLSLLGIAATGFLIANVFLAEGFDVDKIDVFVKFGVLISLLAFGISSLSALIHRYCVVDMLSWQMQALRREIRANELSEELKKQEKDKAKKEAITRFGRWKTSKVALVIAASTLALASLMLAITFGRVVWIINI